MSRVSLDQIDVPTACAVPWEQMRGDDVARFCGQCQKHVYDLSAMTRSEAERLLCEKAGNLCAQFQRSADGRIVTLDYEAPQPKAAKHWWGRIIVGLLGGGVAAGLVAPVMTTTRGVVRCRPPAGVGVPFAPAAPGAVATGSQPDPPDDFEL
jgi:hypothetical protein